jgi:hypothetical protein
MIIHPDRSDPMTEEERQAVDVIMINTFPMIKFRMVENPQWETGEDVENQKVVKPRSYKIKDGQNDVDLRDIDSVNKLFNRRLIEKKNGEIKYSDGNEKVKVENEKNNFDEYVFQLGTPSAVLSEFLADRPIVLHSDILDFKKSKNYTHPFEFDDIRNLPYILSDPIAIFNDDNNPNRIVVVTSNVDKNGENIIVIIDLVNDGNSVKVNNIFSLYPKNSNSLLH